MDLVAVDWFKDTKRMDHVVRRQGCAAQVCSQVHSCLNEVNPRQLLLCILLCLS